MTKRLLNIPKFRVLFITLVFIGIGWNSYAFAWNVNSSEQLELSQNPKKVSLNEMIKRIEQKGYKFAFDENQVNIYQLVNSTSTEGEIDSIMKNMLSGTQLSFLVKGQQIILTKKMQFNLTAKIIDERTKTPIAGATIIIKGTTNGGISGESGLVAIHNVVLGDILEISFIGYITQEIKVSAGLKEIVVTMKKDAIAIEDVIVTGYQKISKERTTGSFATLSSEDLNKKIQTDLISNIEGIVPGLMVTNGNVSIRGVSTIYGNNKPLYVVDGFPWEGDINSLSTDNIENITVLKDAAAASIYGSRSANGVIVITTKTGKAGKPKIAFSANVFLTQLPDLHNDRLTSSELVDLQVDFFNTYKRKYDLVKKNALPEAINLMYQKQRGIITSDDELNAKLNILRNRDNESQYRDNMLRNRFKQQYNLNISGGSEVNTYYLSADYVDEKQYSKGNDNNRINLNFKDNLNVTKWLSAEIGTMISFDESKSSLVEGSRFLNSRPSYEMLLDENNNTTAWSYGKSQEEKDRLKALGLNEERYNPLDENDNYSNNFSSFYLRFSAAVDVKITKGLNFNVMYQTEKTSSKNKELYSSKSYFVEEMVNNAAQVSPDGEIMYNVPIGAQIKENKGLMSAYTLRTQLTFDRTFSKHSVSALIGAERRKIASEATDAYRMGYDDRGLSWALIDSKKLSSGLLGTESINGEFRMYNYDKQNGFLAEEDRFISFYANAGYTFDRRYSFTASVRIDESNLFGTDPKYRYAPLWSVGGSWNISNEKIMENVTAINRLVLRLTYGLNGNVSKLTGPYLIVNSGYDSNNQTSYNEIQSPPNDQLRWEKTKTFNAGIDLSVVKNRINVSFDYYMKESSDLLGQVSKDPTLGWSTAIINYGSMKNNGIELALNTLNINKKFKWRSSFIFSHNTNKLTESANMTPSIVNYISGEAIQDYPLNPLFSYKWAGLSDKGQPQIYDEKGGKVTGVQSIDALVYGGTSTPKYTGSFSNNLSYKNFELSFMFTFNGGNVIREYSSPIISNYESINNNIGRQILNRWQQPGDELKEGVTPAFYPDATYFTENLWSLNHTNVVKADYIRLRNVSLSYSIPQKALQSMKISSVQLLFQVQNAFIWTANDQRIDPEMSFGANRATGIVPNRLKPTYIFGINVTL